MIMFIRVSLLLTTIMLAGCSTFPEKLQVEDTSQLVSYQDAASKAEQVKGQTIRWGGAIAKVVNKAESTVLELVYYPLTGYGKPISGDESMGRFRIHVNGFMDPMVYRVGRLMSFTAQLTDLEEGLVGEHKYIYPTANVKAYHLWKNIQRIDINRVHVWPSSYWYGHYPRPYHRGFIIRGSVGNSSHKVNNSRPSGATTLPKPVRVRQDRR
jgi:outer membrane lipoprotein